MLILYLIVGLALLVWSSDLFVSAASRVATRAGLPEFWVGMVIVGFGTSLPELLVSVFAAHTGSGSIALGNVIGSNIANIGLILGVTACLWPVALLRRTFARELGSLLSVSVLALWWLSDGVWSRIDAALALGVFALLIGVSTLRRATPNHAQSGPAADAATLPFEVSRLRLGLQLFGGLGLLLASSRLLVWSAVQLAESWGMGEQAIGLTIVAVGTSLPELAASVAAARKGKSELVLGNVLGSNLFNLLFVLGVAGLVAPMGVSASFVGRDGVVMLGFTVALCVAGLWGTDRRHAATDWGGPGVISRTEGAFLVIGFMAYSTWLLAESAG